MAHPTIAHLSIPKTGLLLAISPSMAWRKATAGAFGLVTRDQSGVQVVSIAEVERASRRTFTKEQIEAAAIAPAQLSPSQATAKRQRKAAETNTATLQELDLTFAKIAAACHDAWTKWVSDPEVRKARPKGPSIEAAEAIFKTYELHTSKQLRDAIDAALTQRDADWRRWHSSAAARAVHPFGPAVRTL